jgi:hypothetical protein
VNLTTLAARLRRRRPSRPAQPVDALFPTRHEQNTDGGDLLPTMQLCSIVKSWMDEDVIEAVVLNAFAQGSDRVYLVDNGSTDDTVRRAEAAGATVAEVYDTPSFDGPLSQTVMNGVVVRESLGADADHIWWHYLDSDEFAEGPDGLSVREYLAGLDRRFRVVGSTFVNHLPSGSPQYIRSFHPIDFQPLCYTFVPSWTPICGQNHWKHPLQRFDRCGAFAICDRGAHAARCAEPLVEPTGGITTHHFQYRDERMTRAKLQLTWQERTGLYGPGGNDGFSRRSRSIDAVYDGRWADVEYEVGRTVGDLGGPRSWPALAGVRRWYTPQALEAARAAWTTAAGDPAVSAT